MTRFFDPTYLSRTYRDPIALTILAVDLFPIYAVLTMGWGAAALVWLYWLENVILGGFALARMCASSMKQHPIGLAGMLFIGPFFVFHYGMFCFVHGIFVNVFASMGAGDNPDFLSPWGLIQTGLASAPNMALFICAIIVLQAFLFLRDFIGRGEYRKTTIEKEMTAPYARIVVLHIGIFAGAFALAAMGEPMLGILGLILLRAAWGVFLTMRRRMQLDGILKEKVDGSSSI